MAGIGNKLYMHMVTKTAAPILAGYVGFVCLYHISIGHPDNLARHANLCQCSFARTAYGSGYLKTSQEQGTMLFMKITASELPAWDHTYAFPLTALRNHRCVFSYHSPSFKILS